MEKVEVSQHQSCNKLSKQKYQFSLNIKCTCVIYQLSKVQRFTTGE